MRLSQAPKRLLNKSKDRRMPIRNDTPANSLTLDWLGNKVRLPIRAADTSGILSGELSTLRSGSETPLHVHTREAKCFCVIEGGAELWYSDRTMQLGPGDLAYLPTGLPHRLKAFGSTDTKLLVLLTGGEIENAFVEASDVESVAMKEVFRRYGVEFFDTFDPQYRPVGHETVNEDHAVITRRGEGQAFWLAGDTYTIMLWGHETDNQLAVVHFDIPPGGEPLPHVHGRDFEAFVITDGEVELFADGKTIVGKPDDVAVLPVNIPHCFKNRTHRTSQMIAVIAPAGFERFIAEAGRPAVAGESPPPIDDAEKSRLIEAAPRYGITLRPDIKF